MQLWTSERASIWAMGETGQKNGPGIQNRMISQIRKWGENILFEATASSIWFFMHETDFLGPMVHFFNSD